MFVFKFNSKFISDTAELPVQEASIDAPRDQVSRNLELSNEHWQFPCTTSSGFHANPPRYWNGSWASGDRLELI